MGLINTPIMAMFAVVVFVCVYKSTANLSGGIGGVIKNKGSAVIRGA